MRARHGAGCEIGLEPSVPLSRHPYGRDRRGHPPAFNEPEEDAKLSHHPTFRDPDHEPGARYVGNGRDEPAEALANELESRLFKGRKVMVFGQITDKLARDVVARILALVDEFAKPIQIYVNSPGGHVESGELDPRHHQVCAFQRADLHDRYRLGGLARRARRCGRRAGSAFACRTRASCCINRWGRGAARPSNCIDIEAREIIKMRERLSQIIATETGQSIERVRRDTDRNYWMSASEAIDYGLASKIVHSIEDLK